LHEEEKMKQYDSDRNAVDWLKEISNKKINGKSIIERLTFMDEDKEVSIWWWMDSWLYYCNSFGKAPIREIIHSINTGKPIKEYKKRRGTSLYISMKPIIRKIYWRFIKKNNKEKNKLLFLSFIPYEEGKEQYMEDIYNKFENKIIMDCPHRVGFELKKLKEKVKKEGKQVDCIESYMKIDYKKVITIIKSIYRKFRELLIEYEFIYNNKNISIDVIYIFAEYFKSRFESHLIQYFTYKNMINRLEPSIIVSPLDSDVEMRQLKVLCEDKNIPIIGMQHGTIGYCPDSVHLKSEMEGDFPCPIPTKTLVWSESNKNFLIKHGNYPEDKVIVTGNSRYDIFNDYKVKDEGYILLCTNKMSDEDKRKIITNACVYAKEQNKELIIKPHPGEYDTNLHVEIAKLFDNCYIVSRNSNTFELLKNCSLLISTISTVLYEAKILNKPVKLISLGDLKDYLTEKEIDDFNYKNDGKATKKIIEVIRNELIQK